jgi:hypothetical protein
VPRRRKVAGRPARFISGGSAGPLFRWIPGAVIARKALVQLLGNEIGPWREDPSSGRNANAGEAPPPVDRSGVLVPEL